MALEERAHGAPQQSFVHSPTGFRRLTPNLLRADRAAEKFTGFPEGVSTHGQLLGAFKAAAPRLGISPRLIHMVDYLFCHTKAQDWKPDSRPIVWPSNETLGIALGLERSQVKALTRQLIEFELVTMKDSPNGHRYGHRHPNNDSGRITVAYGFDLSLFAVRYAEFVQVAEEHKAERKAFKKLRRRRTIAHNAIIQILDTAEEYGFEDEEWQLLSRETIDLIRSLKTVDRLDEMEAGVKSLERRWQGARERLEQLLGTVDSTPKGPENRPHYYNYNPTVNLDKDTVIAANKCSGAEAAPPSHVQKPEPEPASSQSPARPHSPRTPNGKFYGTTPDELVQLAPKLRQYLRRPDPDWRDIVDAADWLRSELEVSKSLWGEACLAMGRELAALALAIGVSTRPPEHFKSGPGGYFHGIVAKHIAGTLRIEGTIWSLRRANNPGTYADRQRSPRQEGFDA